MSLHEASTTLCLAVAVGALLIALADRLRIPSIALLLVGGVLLGPEVLGIIEPDTLGRGLELVVTLAVAVVLFEGGLTLDVSGFRRGRVVITRMLTVGVLITWVGASMASMFLFGLSIELAAIAGSLLVVTGPTVISPLLRRIDLEPSLHHVLYWEGVLIDAVGVFFAVLCFEWILASGEGEMVASLGRFGLRFITGAGVGALVGAGLALALRRHWVGLGHINVVVAGGVLLAFGGANFFVSEAGILAVIAAGLVLRISGVPGLTSLKRFKLELTELAVGLLFVLLSARLDLRMMFSLGAPLALFVGIVLLLRPLNIVVSTWGQGMPLRERAFLSWLAPRGIVAASMASLFAIRLQALGYEQAVLLDSLTFAVIASTVLVQGLSAPAVARLLRVNRPAGGTWVLIGDTALSFELQRNLRLAGGRALALVEPGEVSMLSHGSADVILSRSFDPATLDDQRVSSVEAVVALSDRPEINDRICELWAPVVGPDACHRWDRGDGVSPQPGHAIWQNTPAPNRVRVALEEGRSAIDTFEAGDAIHLGPRLQPLFSVEGGRIGLAHSGGVASDGATVVLRGRIPGLAGLVRDGVILDSGGASLHDVFAEVLALAARDVPELNAAEGLAVLEEREKDMSSMIGRGVAIPHLYVGGIAESRCYVARLGGRSAPVGPDGMPLLLAFLVLSSPANANGHLQSLAAISELAQTEGLIEQAARQRTRSRLLAMLRHHE